MPRSRESKKKKREKRGKKIQEIHKVRVQTTPNNSRDKHLPTQLNDPCTLTQDKSNYKPNNPPKTTPDQLDHTGKTTALKRQNLLQENDRIGNDIKRIRSEEQRSKKQEKATSKKTGKEQKKQRSQSNSTEIYIQLLE